jgi:hypothetical protein
VTVYALQTLLRPATIEEAFNPKPGHLLFDWGEKTYVYDGGLAEAFMADAPTSTFCDQVLRTAAAAMLEATGEIGNPRLRSFACACLTGGATPISKTKRGRSSKDTWVRDTVIVGRLIPPLLERFNATRNKASRNKDGAAESACSIVQKALAQIRHNMTEKRVEDIWARWSHLVLAK